MSPSSSASAQSMAPKPARSPGAAMPTAVALPARMDFTAARELHARLHELKGSAVAIDGKAVVFGGALAAQVLLSAALDWSGAGETFVLTISPALRDDLQRLDVLGRFPTLIEVV